MRLISRREMAERIDINPKTLDKLVADGMPHYFVGKRIRFDVDEVREWLKRWGKNEQ